LGLEIGVGLSCRGLRQFRQALLALRLDLPLGRNKIIGAKDSQRHESHEDEGYQDLGAQIVRTVPPQNDDRVDRHQPGGYRQVAGGGPLNAEPGRREQVGDDGKQTHSRCQDASAEGPSRGQGGRGDGGDHNDTGQGRGDDLPGRQVRQQES